MPEQEITPAPEAPATPQPENGSAKTVGYEHFQRVVNAKQGLEAQVVELKGQLSTALERAANVDTLAGKLTEAQTATAAAEARFTSYREIGQSLGVTDPEVVELAEWSWSKLPAEGRPSIGDWLTSLRGEPASAPVALRPFLGAAPEATPAAPPAPGQSTSTTPRPPATTTTAPGAPSSVSADAIRQARDIGVRTGNWTRYKELSVAAGYRQPVKT
tara:strand:- start:13777 stop:14424 length:648 start_codon:yes stop_codon:yes gene_type:complete